jgi:hypothetical protein
MATARVSDPEPATIHERPVELLQNLIRFDTTNPLGNEKGCIAYIGGEALFGLLERFGAAHA